MLTVAYDGTNYCGWQIQPNVPTIEGVLNRVIGELTHENIFVIGASRTDAGVHAKGAIAVFDTDSTIPAEKFSYAINTKLPEDIVIRKSEEVAGDFHPRKTDVRKTYRYRLYNDDFSDPIICRYAHHVYGKLDIEKMNEAAVQFVGEHDFKGFCSAHNQTETTVRTIYDLHVCEGNESGTIDIYVTGNGFLYNMVRIIAGTLVDVGRGKTEPKDISGIILSCDRAKAGITAPAKGLTLMGYVFG